METLMNRVSTYVSNPYVLIGAVVIGLVITAVLYTRFFSPSSVPVDTSDHEQLVEPMENETPPNNEQQTIEQDQMMEQNQYHEE